MSTKYVILDADDVPAIVFSEVLETSADTLRYNVAETQVLLKYRGAKPLFLYGLPTYSYSQILEILATAAWSPGKLPDED